MIILGEHSKTVAFVATTLFGVTVSTLFPSGEERLSYVKSYVYSFLCNNAQLCAFMRRVRTKGSEPHYTDLVIMFKSDLLSAWTSICISPGLYPSPLSRMRQTKVSLLSFSNRLTVTMYIEGHGLTESTGSLFVWRQRDSIWPSDSSCKVRIQDFCI